jgi:hypothetical protein
MTSAELLSRFRRDSGRPTADESLTDATIYSYLTDAQGYWAQQLATHVPEEVYGRLRAIQSTDDGYTYRLPAEPIGPIALYPTRSGEPLMPGPEWDERTGYVLSGQTISFPGGVARAFGDGGPWVRMVAAPGAIDVENEPSLSSSCHPLILYRALFLWASRPNSGVDGNVYLNLESDHWSGRDGDPADVGVLGALKVKHYSGMHRGSSAGAWWKSSDLGR